MYKRQNHYDAQLQFIELKVADGRLVFQAIPKGRFPFPDSPPAPAPKIEYAKVTQGQMAASVAKEVGRSMWPVFLLAALVIAALIYLLVR